MNELQSKIFSLLGTSDGAAWLLPDLAELGAIEDATEVIGFLVGRGEEDAARWLAEIVATAVREHAAIGRARVERGGAGLKAFSADRREKVAEARTAGVPLRAFYVPKRLA